MFLHRRLPPPAYNPLIGPGSPQPNVRRDSIQESRIMTSEQGRDLSEASKKSASPESPSLPSLHERGPVVPSSADPSNVRTNGTRISGRYDYTVSNGNQGNDPLNNIPKAEPAETDDRTHPTVSPSQVCLCQPDPKVPRPRNAFILFRQHHQAEVAKTNPSAANPEISKIIGDYWRRSSPETKGRWKRLAEEEKARHQKQYPEYRYQPRRAGRGSSAAGTSSEADQAKCPKCGGRSMTASRLPSPATAATATQTATPVPKPEPVTMTPEHVLLRDQRPSPPSSGSSTHARMGPYLNSPPPVPPGRYGSRGSYAPSYGSMSYGGYPKNEPISSPIISPDMKRRKFEYASYPVATIPRQNSVSMGGLYDHASRRPSLVAVPRPEHIAKAYTHAGLPAPLTATAPPNHSPAALAPLRTPNNTSQAKSVEAMVMSIPPLGKVRMLAKVSPPLAEPGPTSPTYTTRGAVIAVEGTDDEVLKAVISHLRNRLQQTNEHRVRLFSPGSFTTKSPSFADWLKVIQSWHSDSAAIRDFITTVPGNGPTPATSPVSVTSKTGRSVSSVEPDSLPLSDGFSASEQGTEVTRPSTRPSDAHESENIEMTDADGETEQTAAGTSPSSAAAAAGTKRKASDVAPDDIRSQSSLIPVAIVPRYQLTLTDLAASSIPIADDYSPVDHWQWMAAMWRGIVGPDVTVVVRAHGGAEDHGPGPDGKKPGDVEVRLADYRTIVLRYEKGGRVSESALRRAGFEMEEFLRTREEQSGGGM